LGAIGNYALWGGWQGWNPGVMDNGQWIVVNG